MPVKKLLPYHSITNVLFHVEEGHFNRADYSVMLTNRPNVRDVTYFWIFAYDYTCRLPLEKYPNATRAFCLLQDNSGGTARFYLGPDTNTWTEVPLEFKTNGLFSVVIPADLRSNALWFKTVAFANYCGFGLGTTNAMTDFERWAGRWFGDSKANGSTLTSSGVPAWLAYSFETAMGDEDHVRWVLGPDVALSTPSLYPYGDFNGDGMVDQGELNAVLSNYWPNSPWLYMTNTAGLGSTNVQFALTNASAWNFSVLMSSNLLDWDYLGPAYPMYQFLDPAAATNPPQRFYRLRWP